DVVVPLADHPGGSFRFRTNNLGLRRDVDTAIDKPPELFRVLMLGESQTEGYVNNEESFPTLLEARLAGQLSPIGRRAEVLNAGVGGYKPTLELQRFQVRGAPLRPDLVVVFVAGNDVQWGLSESWQRTQAERRAETK